MNNRDIYQRDPSTSKLVNEGVASVNDETTISALRVLRYELDTFVCDGQYEKGMRDILETYLKNIDQSQQPSVWISGFYGSGKSHLVKMLRSLWSDTLFEDGATARGITSLPQNISDLFVELSNQAKRHGGLFAASGTLGSSANGSVRLAILSVIFKAADLPEQYPVAKFVMWLKSEGIFDSVKAEVEKNGDDWNEELDNFYVAEGLHEALSKAKPNLFSSAAVCVDTLNNLYPFVQDVSSDDMIKAIKQALTKEDKFPLSIIVLDEVQQFIGEDSQRSIDVQEMVEAITKNIGSKLMFIGTGQTAVTGTANLARLQGRFTLRIELSDSDVDTVIRKVILAKKPEVKDDIESIMQTNLGEISRHLAGTTIGHTQDDIKYFSQDYPILPVRRRFWENALRILDQTGTDSQLRNQLSMIHKVIQSNLDMNIGDVVPADYLYFDSAEKLLQARVLPRKVHEKTMTWLKGSDDEQLMSRATGLVFLINKLTSFNKEIGINATVDALADLMVTDLSTGSGALRSKLPELLDNCDLLMKVGNEYRIQTEESSAWNDEFLSQKNQLANESHKIDNDRGDRIRKEFSNILKRFALMQGNSKVSREIFPIFGSYLPNDSNKKVCIWIRDGWSTDENSVQADAREAGNDSPTVFVFLPKRSADDLRHNLIEYKAASATLDIRGVPNTPEGVEARAAMETLKQTSEGKISALLDDSFSGVRMFQAGGNEILGNNLQEMALEAANNSLSRLYPQFNTADHTGWAKVYDNAKKGAPDSLKAVAFDGEAVNNPVCKAINNFIAGGKKGLDIRDEFRDSPYGWSQDAIDGALQALQVAGIIKAVDERGKGIDFKSLERKMIGKSTFKVESTTITTPQRIQIRKLLQKLNITAKNGEELSHTQLFIQNLMNLAQSAGGEEPRPVLPDTKLLDDIRLATGNEQLLALYNNREALTQNIENWTTIAQSITSRMPEWEILQGLSLHVDGIKDVEIVISQINHLKSKRQLLDEPNPIEPLTTQLTQLLREELNRLIGEYETNYTNGMQLLDEDENWRQIEQGKKHDLLEQNRFLPTNKPEVNVATTAEVVQTLRKINLESFANVVEAMPTRFNTIATKAAEILEPEVKTISLSRRTLKTTEEVEAWIQETEKQLKEAIANGPIRIS
jgi:hypothetical protein